MCPHIFMQKYAVYWLGPSQSSVLIGQSMQFTCWAAYVMRYGWGQKLQRIQCKWHYCPSLYCDIIGSVPMEFYFKYSSPSCSEPLSPISSSCSSCSWLFVHPWHWRIVVHGKLSFMHPQARLLRLPVVKN